MFRRKQKPEQGANNTSSLKCFLCQGNWTGTNIEALKDHLEKNHKVVFKIKELIELSQPSRPPLLEKAKASPAPVTRNRSPPPLPENKELSKAMASPAPFTRNRSPPPLPENKELSKASQEAVLRRHILLENEKKKKYNMAVTETGETILYCVYSTLYS